MSPAQTAAADRRLILGGGACIAVGLLSLVLRLTGALPSGLATVAILLVLVIGLRIFVGYAAKSASSVHHQRITRLISVAGLGFSVVAVIAFLPTLVRGGGAGHLTSNLLAHLWTVLLLLVAVGTARTLTWLTLIGLALTAFLGVSGVAYAIGRPVVKALGESNLFAVAVYVPVTEEVLKALPALLLLIFAARRRTARPSAIEMALLGAILGSGFSLYEDAQYHRGGFDLTAMPLVSFLNPTATNDSDIHVTYFDAGHMVWTALVVFGLAVGILYRRRYTLAKFAIPVTFATSLLEHCTQDLIAFGQGDSAIFELLRVVTVGGWLSSLLLIAGVIWMARQERRVTSGGLALTDAVASSLWLRPGSASRAGSALATLQGAGGPPVQAASP